MSVLEKSLEIWSSGGWLIWPLLAMTIFLYHSVFRLYLHLRHHFILSEKVYLLSDQQIHELWQDSKSPISAVMMESPSDPKEISRHYAAVSDEYIPYVDRRLKFISRMIPLGPLIGLLGTVTGMLSTFQGMTAGQGDKFSRIVEGISEALITTQTGLIISIPALVFIALLKRKRDLLAHGIVRLERYQTTLTLRVGCPVPSRLRLRRNQNPHNNIPVNTAGVTP